MSVSESLCYERCNDIYPIRTKLITLINQSGYSVTCCTIKILKILRKIRSLKYAHPSCQQFETDISVFVASVAAMCIKVL